MALTREKNIQIAVLNNKGWVVEAIARKAGVSKEEVKESLDNKGRSYVELGAMSRGEKAEYIAGLSFSRIPIEEITERTGLGKSSCYNYIKEGAASAKKKNETAKADVEKALEQGLQEGTVVVNDVPEVEVKAPTEKYREAIKWAKDNGVDPENKEAFIESLYKSYRKAYIDQSTAKDGEDRANIALGNAQREIKALKEKCEKLEAEKEQFINSPCECDNSRIIKVCETELTYAEKGMLGIYSKLSEAEKRAWDLGEIFGGLMRARGEFV